MPLDFLPSHHRPIELLRYAGLMAWLCAGLPLLIPGLFGPEPLPRSAYFSWWGLQLLFGFMYWHYLHYLPSRTSRIPRLLYLLVLTGCALGTSLVSNTTIAGILLLIVSGLLPWMLPAAMATVMLLAQNLLLGLVFLTIEGSDGTQAAVEAGLFLGISLFVFIGSLAALREQESRDELRKLNHELRATQALLAQNTRIAERVRIARELHDRSGRAAALASTGPSASTWSGTGTGLTTASRSSPTPSLMPADPQLASSHRCPPAIGAGACNDSPAPAVPC